MLLSSAPLGEVNQIKAIWVEDETKTVLEKAGITVGCEVFVVSRTYGNAIIVGVHDRRIAIGAELARKIIV